MKRTTSLALCIINLLIAVIIGCEKKKVTEVISEIPPAKEYRVDVITTKPTSIEGSTLVLPVGTRIQLTKDDLSLVVTLPSTHSFLVENADSFRTSLKTLPVYPIATYTCVCSDSKTSCQVFYQEDAGGFGCLHQSCTGTCAGNFVTPRFEQIVGVIRTDYRDVTIPKNLPFTGASLLPGAKERFFEIPEVQRKIEEQYELMYRYMVKPDFTKFNPGMQSLRDFVFLQVQLYGVDFYMLGPAGMSKRTDLFTTYTTKASCKCSDEKALCSLGSGGFLGWKVYYCKGTCNGCQLTISKSVSPGINLPDNSPPLEPIRDTLIRNF